MVKSASVGIAGNRSVTRGAGRRYAAVNVEPWFSDNFISDGKSHIVTQSCGCSPLRANDDGRVDVYLAASDRFLPHPLPTDGRIAPSFDDILPLSRAEEISRCADERVKMQKISAWKLLDRALFLSFGRKIAEVNAKKTDNGKWVCDGVYFSLSHGDRLVAAAVSRSPVGVDVQAVGSCPTGERFIAKILTEEEQSVFLSSDGERRARTLTAFWAVKESLFKVEGRGAFVPRRIPTTARALPNGREYAAFVVSAEGREYVCAVAGDGMKNIRVIPSGDTVVGNYGEKGE